jgi:hypothetical protein
LQRLKYILNLNYSLKGKISAIADTKKPGEAAQKESPGILRSCLKMIYGILL